MREMKDSEIGWIGDIPVTWNIIRAKNIFKNHKDIVGNKEEEYERLALTLNGVLKRSKDDSKGLQSESLSTYQILNKNELVFKMIDLANVNTSRVGYSPFTGIVSPVYIIFNNEKYSKFGYYFFYSMWQREIFNKLGNDGVRSALNASDMLNLSFPDISEEEAKKIADFLDKKVTEIDNIIEKTRETIEDYKKLKENTISKAVTKGINSCNELKESGNVWLGKIPLNWLLLKMDKICEIITDYVASGSFASLAENVKYIDIPDHARLIRTMDISGKYEKVQPVYINEHAYNFLSNSNLYGGEIILPNIGASVGDVYIVPKLYERMSLAPNSIMIKTRYLDKYYYYCFLCNVGRQNLLSISGSTAQPKFNKTEFKTLKFPVPPIEEQKSIVEYLDNKCNQLDKLIECKQKIIEELEQYKKSLIYEYVTGKKEVI